MLPHELLLLATGHGDSVRQAPAPRGVLCQPISITGKLLLCELSLSLQRVRKDRVPRELLALAHTVSRKLTGVRLA